MSGLLKVIFLKFISHSMLGSIQSVKTSIPVEIGPRKFRWNEIDHESEASKTRNIDLPSILTVSSSLLSLGINIQTVEPRESW